MSVDGGREVAYRLFAAEFDDSTLSHTESDDERAPNYVITPTGARVNRLFLVGTLTEVTQVNEGMVRARIVDPTGAFVVYAGQYQPDQLAFLERAEPPLFLAVTGKARTFEPDDGDRVYTSVRPESVASVDADTRDRWVVDAAERTVARIGTYAAAAAREERGEELTAALEEDGVETGLTRGIPLAIDHYATTPGYLAGLHELALESARVVAGELDEVSGFDLRPETPVADAPGFPSLAAASEPAAATGAPDTPRLQDEPSAADSEPGGEDVSAGSEGGAEIGEPTEPGVGTEATTGPESEGGDPPDDGPEQPDVEPIGEEPTPVADEPATDGELGEFDSGGMYEMDEDERAELEAEFGAEFTTGTEVDEPGEADIDVPDPEEIEPTAGDLATGDGAVADVDSDAADPPSDGEPGPVDAVSSEGTADDEATGERATADGATGERATADGATGERATAEEVADAGATAEGAEDVDLLEYVVETMGELDDGDGAARDRLTERVVDELGVEEGSVDDAIQDALMGGRCYEPDDGRLKPI